MTEQTPPAESDLPSPSAMSELDSARDDLTRLSALLRHAFSELLASFGEVQSLARETGSLPELEQFAGRAITALQCEDMATQLIAHTQKRLSLAQDSLKNSAQMPQMRLTSAAWSDGGAPSADPAGVGPVQQDAIHAGSIELF
jgi:hypothetical protein